MSCRDSRKGPASWVPAVILAIAIAGTAGAQQGRRAAASDTQPDFRVDVALAIIPVTVTDSTGGPVAGLSRENFRLFEDGVEQRVAFLAGEDLPVSVCLVFDLSASMRNKMRTASRAVITLLKSFDQPDDEFCLIVFNERPKVAVSFTRNVHEIEEILGRARPVGRTALLDAIHLAGAQMRVARNARKVIVIISDGGDNHSRLTRADISQEMRESDVQVYAMSVPRDELQGPSTLAIEEQNGPLLLSDVARQTGGRHIELTRLSDLPATCAEIARKLHSQYLLGYSPSAHDGRTHRIKVTVTSEDSVPFEVFHRSELYIPAH